jgi:hypothetical protein
METTGLTPSELLNLPPLEFELITQSATELEKWRWDNWNKLFGGE